jgi:precorrin-2 dehydrogenase/sirohydrochlorin ferrochelatase
VNLCLAGLPVLVVGAGQVALRKVRGLLIAKAAVTVVAPQARPELEQLADLGRLTLHRRAYRRGDVQGFRLVFVATGVREVDEQVVQEAARAGLFINVADVPDLCTFYLPAVIRRGHLQLGVTTDGLAPFAARRLRRNLEGLLADKFADWLAGAGAFRQAVLAAVADPQQREELFERFFHETLPLFSASPAEPVILEREIWRRWIEEASSPKG